MNIIDEIGILALSTRLQRLSEQLSTCKSATKQIWLYKFGLIAVLSGIATELIQTVCPELSPVAALATYLRGRCMCEQSEISSLRRCSRHSRL